MNAWGLSCTIDLKSCNPETIRSKDAIANFAKELVELIKMKAYGDPQVVHFGEDPKVSGYSLVQLIETSLISGHFAEETNAVYLDVFSCKEYDPKVAGEFAKTFFQADSVEITSTFRS
ncbi:MAG: S-adenosylmethionine decarboxylase [SAR324 cluster bacterium]|nr:S-adenosylmethionine decarboxylase [SAR324 cluster bacterium]